MPIYWTYRSLPELANLPPRERRRLLKNCRWKPFKSIKVWCQFTLLTLLFLALYVGLDIIALLLKTWIPFPMTALTLTSIELLAVVFSFTALNIHHLRPHLRAQRGTLCTHCGYDLRASPTRCPECGTPLPPSQS